MLNDHIIVSDLVHSTSLVTRETARNLFSAISRLPVSSITLDFSNVDYISRSFFDEVNSQKKKLSYLGKTVTIVNLKDSLEQLQQIVQSTLDRRNTGFFSSMANAEIVSM